VHPDERRANADGPVAQGGKVDSRDDKIAAQVPRLDPLPTGKGGNQGQVFRLDERESALSAAVVMIAGKPPGLRVYRLNLDHGIKAGGSQANELDPAGDGMAGKKVG
jgi:hypothetical protein